MKFQKALLFLTLISSNFHPVNAQVKKVDNIVGTNFLIKSEVLDEIREIQVYLPDSYDTSDKNYPVLYLLDGQRLFLYGVSLLKSFTHFKKTPEFIVVGITNKYPDRFSHFSSESDNFLSFIEKDVIQLIDDNFRTSGERLISGWEYGGGFVIQAMMDKPELFDAYLAASPYPLSKKTQRMDSLLVKNHTTFNKMLYFSASLNEGIVTEGANKLDGLLKLKAPDTMNWIYNKLDDEEHSSTPYSTIYHGVKHYYHYYPILQFTSFEEFIKIGGITYLNHYYKKRAEQFGFSPELPHWTKYSIISTAIKANKYIEFDLYASKFITVAFINGLRGNQHYNIAEFYLDNKEYDKAIDVYKILISKYPKSEKPLNSLGDLYTLLNNKKEASKYYKKAEELLKN